MELAQTTGRRLGLLELQARAEIRKRLIDDRGEGVISMAIAILIVAVIGAAMYAVFNSLAADLGDKAGEEVDKIGA